MKPEKKAIFIFLGTLFLSIILSVFAFYWDTPRDLFQNKTIPSPLLAFGETGKILRELGSISPLENKRISSRITTNPVEFIRRVARERSKWLLLERFDRFKESGIFGYIEMQSQEPAVRFRLEVMKNGSWVEQVSSQIKSEKFGYSFFIDSDSTNPQLRLTFRNKQYPVNIYGIGFLKNGYHPLVFNDQVGFSSFFRHSLSKNITYTESAALINPLKQTEHLTSNLSFQKKPSVGISKFHKKQGQTPIELTASRDHHLLNNLNISDQSLAATSIAKIPVLAIDIENIDLYAEEYGILTNYDGHGREWERLGYVRFFKDGQAVFSTFNGVRLQGGDPGREQGLINFRLYFREEYGTSQIESDKIFDGSVQKIKRLAVKQSEWKQWPLNSPIAYDVTRQAGGLAPMTEMCLLYLNGQNLGLYYMVPHLGEKQIKAMLPEEDYQYFRIRGTPHEADYHFFSSFEKKIKEDVVMDEQYASQFVDLENLVQSTFSYMINATTDYCQGVLLKGSSRDSKYFWYNWDFDHSYIDVPVEIRNEKVEPRERWEQPPSFADFVIDTQGQKPHHCARFRLFTRLVNEDPDFREKTKILFTSTINHRVTQNFVAQLLDDYQQVLTTIDYPEGDEHIGTLRTYFTKRIPYLLKEMEQQFPTDPAIVCEVTSDSYPVIVDGYKKEGPYYGYYFPGSTLAVAPADSGEVRYWLVNGKRTLKQKIALSISSGQECQVHGVN